MLLVHLAVKEFKLKCLFNDKVIVTKYYSTDTVLFRFVHAFQLGRPYKTSSVRNLSTKVQERPCSQRPYETSRWLLQEG